MRQLLFSFILLIVGQPAFAADFLKQANADYLGMVKKVKIVQEVSSRNKLFKYVHLRAYIDENSENEYWETVYLLDVEEEIISKITSAGKIRHIGYISNYLGEITSIKIPKTGHLAITQLAPQTDNNSSGKKYISLYKKINKRLKLMKLSLVQSDAEDKVLIDNTAPKTDFLREAIIDYMFIDSITDFKVVKKIPSHDGTKTYVHGRAISPTKFDDPKWWDVIYVVDSTTGKILSRLIDGNVVAGESNLRYFMGQVESISLTKSGFIEVTQGPSRLKDKSYSVVTYEDSFDYLKIISIEVINEDGSRVKNQ